MKKRNVKKLAAVFVIMVLMLMITGCLTTVSSAAIPGDVYPASATEGAPEGFMIHEKVIEEYDEAGNRIKRTIVMEDGKEKLRTFMYEYDETGFMVKRLTYNKNQNLTEYEIYDKDEAGRRVKETEFRPTGALKNYKVYEFNDNENRVIKRYFDPDNKIYRFIISNHDSSGNLLDETDYRIIE